MGISDLRKDLAAFTKDAKEAVRGKNEEEAMKAIRSSWKRFFHGTLDSESVKGFVKHFRTDRSTRKQRKQRGGMAPIAYQMGPGISSATINGHYPTDASTDPQSKHDMDVYFNSGMSRTAGTESWRFPTVPPGMGSNKVGGRRTRRSKKQKGGNLLQTIGQIPFLPGAPTTSVQTAYAAYSGQPSTPSSDSTSAAWSYSNLKTTIDPSNITRIGSDINKLVSPTPWK